MNRRIAGFCALIVFIALAFYGIQLPEAERVREITYVAEIRSNPEKFENSDIILIGNTRHENGKILLEDKTGSIEITGNDMASRSTIIHGRYEDGKIVVSAIHSISFTKSVFVAIGGIMVLAVFLFYWKFDSRLNIIEKRKWRE